MHEHHWILLLKWAPSALARDRRRMGLGATSTSSVRPQYARRVRMSSRRCHRWKTFERGVRSGLQYEGFTSQTRAVADTRLPTSPCHIAGSIQINPTPRAPRCARCNPGCSTGSTRTCNSCGLTYARFLHSGISGRYKAQGSALTGNVSLVSLCLTSVCSSSAAASSRL